MALHAGGDQADAGGPRLRGHDGELPHASLGRAAHDALHGRRPSYRPGPPTSGQCSTATSGAPGTGTCPFLDDGPASERSARCLPTATWCLAPGQVREGLPRGSMPTNAAPLASTPGCGCCSSRCTFRLPVAAAVARPLKMAHGGTLLSWASRSMSLRRRSEVDSPGRRRVRYPRASSCTGRATSGRAATASSARGAPRP